MNIWVIFASVLKFCVGVICEYQCTMESFEVSCSKIEADQLSNEVSVLMKKEDIVSLNLTNSIISTISPNTFKDFTNLENLYITDSGVANLEDNAFAICTNLKLLNISGNLLTQFNTRAISLENTLNNIDLSNNLLNDLSDFNISYFPKLSILNLANNRLLFLPLNLIEKLQEENELYFVVDNNPWDCSHPVWSQHLNQKFIDSFCTNKTFNYIPKPTTNQYEYNLKDANTQESQTHSKHEATTQVSSENISTFIIENQAGYQQREPNCAQCSFYYCLVWCCGGVWMGIIIGNVVKIKNLLFQRQKTYAEKYVQCEYHLMEMRPVFPPNPSNRMLNVRQDK